MTRLNVRKLQALGLISFPELIAMLDIVGQTDDDMGRARSSLEQRSTGR